VTERATLRVGMHRRIARLGLAAATGCAAAAGFAETALDVPFVRQIRRGCGPAAVAMVMQYWAGQLGLDGAAADAEKIDRALPASSKGVSGAALKEYLEDHGFAAYVFSGELSDLRHHIAKGRPVVVCLGLKGPGGPLHFVVVTGVGDGAVTLNDSTRGKMYREGMESFLRAWKAARNWAMLAVPRPGP